MNRNPWLLGDLDELPEQEFPAGLGIGELNA
jgi:hypothetical protein